MTQRRQQRSSETVNGRPADLDHELTKGFAGRRIRFRAWQLACTCGFSGSDRPDIEQDLRMALFERIDRFDPERAHWNVFVYTVIERAIASMFSGRQAVLRMAAFESDSLSTLVATEDNEQTMLAQLVLPEDQARINGRAIRHHEDEVDRAEDVETILDMLPDELRDIAERLMTNATRGRWRVN